MRIKRFIKESSFGRFASIAALTFVLALFTFSCRAMAADIEVEEAAADDVTKLQLEISRDIGKLREAVYTELKGIKLAGDSVSLRLNELAALSDTASEDMAAWGYIDEQRERHTQILSELAVAYAAYDTLTHQIQQTNGAPTDVQAQTVASVDINISDSLRKEINKVSRGLDLQVFYLQSKINKLKLDLDDVERLKKETKDAMDGTALLAMPHTHELELENAKLNVALSSLQVRTTRQGFDQNVALIARLKRRLANAKENLAFPEESLNANVKRIQDRIDKLADEMEAARKALGSATSSSVRARAALTEKDTGTHDNTLSPARSLYIARSARVNYWEAMTFALEDEIRLLREAQQVWRERYKLFRDDASGDDIWKFRENAEKQTNDLQRLLTGVRTMEEDILRRIDVLQKQTDDTVNTQSKSGGMTQEDRSKIRQNMLQAIETHRKIISDILNQYESLIPDMMFLYQRLYAEAGDRVSAIRIAEKVHSFSRETIMGFLNTELWQGEGYSVTVWRLIVAVIVFLSSFFMSSWGSRWIKRRMIRRLNASETAANAAQRIIFYILWITFALIALNIVEIPLTAFAFMGGAIAVGLGFGMQNIFNNLISGFIVIFSRPFKVNDIISVAGTEGTVQDIGSRSTTIKTWDSLDVILPNRYFLENSVTNWTGSDQKKRNVISVGVSYDSDTRLVEELLLKAVKSHSKVLKEPAPFVIFKDFGESSLDFEIYFWIDLRQAVGPKVSSDIRHHIMSMFRDEGIEIPYPQRDIHVIPPSPSASKDEKEESKEPKPEDDKPNLPA